MVFAGIDGERQVGVRPVSADPLAVEANPQGGAAALVDSLVKDFHHINQALACFGLSSVELILSRLGIELDLRRAARGFGGGKRWILCEGGSCDKQDYDQSGFHGVPPTGNCIPGRGRLGHVLSPSAGSDGIIIVLEMGRGDVEICQKIGGGWAG